MKGNNDRYQAILPRAADEAGDDTDEIDSQTPLIEPAFSPIYTRAPGNIAREGYDTNPAGMETDHGKKRKRVGVRVACNGCRLKKSRVSSLPEIKLVQYLYLYLYLHLYLYLFQKSFQYQTISHIALLVPEVQYSFIFHEVYDVRPSIAFHNYLAQGL